MLISRRRLLCGSIAAAAIGALMTMRRSDESKRVLVNHVGFLPTCEKWCVSTAGDGLTFEVFKADGTLALDGAWREAPAELGQYSVASLSRLTDPGEYALRSAGCRDVRVVVRERVYDDAITKCIGYFARQRCGDSTTGYNAPCHLDDGVRRDSGAPQDVVGGWHDASDV